jgi:spore photoproduct lyase
MSCFIPDFCYVSSKALKYKEGIIILERLKSLKIPIKESSHVVVKGQDDYEVYTKAKNIVFLTVNGKKELESCRPSADYGFSFSSSCPGRCEYCYLQTTQGEKPMIKIFVNREEILGVCDQYIQKNAPNITTFECSAITDPIPTEYITRGLEDCIEFFSKQDFGRLRCVTKFHQVDSFLHLNHNGHTKFRFSVNADYVIETFEHSTSRLEERIESAKKLYRYGYPIGFLIAPIMKYEGWQVGYKELIEKIKIAFKGENPILTFELIQHRFTNRAKSLIEKRFPQTKLDLDEGKRRLKWGPYGQFKHIYTKDHQEELKDYLSQHIKESFPDSIIEYFT